MSCKMTEFVEMDPSGRYGRLNKILGKGAMKIVYRAFDRVLGMEVAWNQVMLNDALRSPDELERLHTEVHLLKNLKHEAIMRFHTSWIQHEHRTFNFITEMFTSGTLTDYRKLYKQVDMRAIKNWARQILGGLVYLHSRDPPVIHRDLKCDNIFVNGHLGQVKIGDLGLAAILRDSQRAHSVIGTPEFMAPELYEEEYNELVDVYSFGMCLLEMVTAEFPYSECLNTAQIYKKVTSGKKPNAYYRIEDMEAQIFIGKCLQVASKRLAAHELLLDPFLATEESLSPGSQQPPLQMYFEKPKNHLSLMVPVRRNDMTITGRKTPEDNTIDLKVQIADANGQARNILFPFDIMNDTAMDVAIEMVKELDIPDRSPFEISEMIEQAVSALIPGWRDHNLHQFQIHSTEQSVKEEEDDDDNASKKAYSPPSLLSFDSSSSIWLNRGEDDDGSCQRSYGNFIYSEASCSSHNSEVVYSLLDENRYGEMEKEATLTTPSQSQRRNMVSSTRYYPEKKAKPKGTCHKQQPISSRSTNNRVQSFMDIRSQLLHQALTQALKKKYLKTVGAVEDIGFQDPRET